MSLYLASLMASSVPVSPQATMQEEMIVAQRFLAAVQNKRDYEESDFIKPPNAQDKAFLSTFSRCKLHYFGHTGRLRRKTPVAFVREPGTVAIGWKCKGLSKKTPNHISLIFRDGKIEKIETHREVNR